MSSNPRRPPWLTLAWWHEQDERLKRALDHTVDQLPQLSPEQTCTLIERGGLVLGIPLLLTPTVTTLLYPWLPQKDAGLFIFYAATCLSAAFLARLKRTELATSESTQDSVSPIPAAGQEMREERLSGFDEETQPGS